MSGKTSTCRSARRAEPTAGITELDVSHHEDRSTSAIAVSIAGSAMTGAANPTMSSGSCERTTGLLTYTRVMPPSAATPMPRLDPDRTASHGGSIRLKPTDQGAAFELQFLPPDPASNRKHPGRDDGGDGDQTGDGPARRIFQFGMSGRPHHLGRIGRMLPVLCHDSLTHCPCMR